VVAAAGALCAPTERPASRDIAALVWPEVAQVAAHYGYAPPHLADSTRAYKAAA
jgi:hypothetical protein